MQYKDTCIGPNKLFYFFFKCILLGLLIYISVGRSRRVSHL